jgi:TolB-like protein/Flp pilus assembly protein TadD
MSFFEELKRRNVIRVGIAYVVIAWIIAQAADLALETFKAPEWVMPSVLLLLFLGLPLALFFAWAFELTPEGLKKDKDVNRAESIAPSTGRKLDFVIIGFLIVGMLYFVWESRFSKSDNESNGIEQTAAQQTAGDNNSTVAKEAHHSIAVLPFADMSSDGDQEYFADGIAEELLNLLARTDGLKVAARTSSFKFKNSDKDISEIGKALKVANVLEGSIRKSGNQLRITAQLIEVGSGFHLWSDTYDRELDDIFAVQDEISLAIVDALKLKLNIDVLTNRKVDGKAYELYLRGRELVRTPDKEGLLRAIDLFEQALSIDDSMAAAYAGIAEAWIWLQNYGGINPDVAFPKAEQAARRAMAIDPNLAEAQTAMGRLSITVHNDTISARQYFERSFELNPNQADAMFAYAHILRRQGEYDRYLGVMRQAVDLDPLSVFNRVGLAVELAGQGQFQESFAIYSDILQENPDSTHAHEGLGHYYYERGEFAKAAEEYFLVHKNRPGDPYSAMRLVGLAILFEDPEMAQYWLAQARKRGADNLWELRAREILYESSGDWLALENLSSQLNSLNAAEVLGVSLLNQGKNAEARTAFLNALELQGYKENTPLTVDVARVLVRLLWAEQRLGMDGVLPRAAEVEAFFSKYPNSETLIARARLASIRGDKEAVLKHLSSQTNFHRISFLELQQDVMFSAWRDEPEFIAIIKRLRDNAAKEKLKLEKSKNADEIFGRIAE